MLTWISDSLAESESGPKDMTAVNAGVHELAGVRLPLQPYAGGHAVFMYSTAADGNVTLQLRDSDDLDRSGLAAMLARLQDDATLSISYQDADILSDGSIDVLLGTATAAATAQGTGTLQGSGATEAVTATFDLFDSSSGHDLTLSPQTFTNSAEAFINDNSNSLGVPADTDTVLVAEEQKKNGNGTAEVVKLTVKRARPKATSPNRQGPQQCQVCAKVFGNASALAKHKLTHSDERKYVCTMCGKAFKRQDHLNGHMLTHRNKKPYECKAEGCGKSYCDARSLRRHTENHHSAAGAAAAASTATSSSTATVSATTSMSPAQGAAAGDAASPHGSSCIQYAPPPTTTATATTPTTTTSPGKSQLQQLLATEPVKGGSGGNNDGLTKQQLDLIHQIMEQTQRQSQPVTKSPAKTAAKPTAKQPSKVQRVWTSTSQQTSSTKTNTSSSGSNPSQVKSTNATSGGATVAAASSGPTSTSSTTPAAAIAKPELKPVECNLCHRKFKNIPALNGHMRLHGGYFKKDAENKKCEKKESTGPPLQTASVSVRALIEEKIISKRTTNPAVTQQSGGSGSAAAASGSGGGAPATTPTESTAPPLYPLSMHSTGDADASAKVTSFVVPAPPAPQPAAAAAAPAPAAARRHSDAEFTVPRAPATAAVQQEAEALADMILKRGGKVSVKRAISDPGRSSQQIQLQFQPGDAFALAGVTYQAEDVGYLSPSLQEDVFHQVQDTMLLQGVDAQQLVQFQASLLQEQDEQLQDIASLEDYATVTASLQETVVDSATYQARQVVNQELQAVLDSPLPESLAEFSTFHTSNLDMPSPSYQTQSPAQQFTNSPHTSLAAQSPLQSPLIRHDSPGFAYPTPPASHEGQSPSFVQTSLLPMISPQQTSDFVQNVSTTRDPEEPPQASSPLSAAFFTSTMSSAAAVEEALEEVLPGESIAPDDIYPSLSNSPPPQSPISVAMTPVPSPLSSIPTSTTSVSSPRPPASFTPVSTNITFPMSPHYTLQSQMMPNSDDPLLSSSPKDFSTRKRFEFGSLQSLKIVGNGYIDFGNPNLAGILVDNNGELKFIQTSGSPIQAKNLIVTSNITSPNTTIKEEIKNVPLQRLQKISKTTQCTIPANKNNIQRPKLHVAVDNVKTEEADDVFLSPTTIPASPNRISRKRPRSEPLQLPVVHQSRLRAARGRPPGAAPYTPLPMLNPSRHGPGLYWNAKLKNTVAVNSLNNQDDSSISSTCESIPESDSTPHINVGSQYQCTVPPCKLGRDRDDREPTYEHLLWDPGINNYCTDNEVDMYLDFACCAAVPGGGRNKEYALHLLHMCGGNIHEAMLKLMQPTPTLPPDHPLLHYHYSESDQWTIAETEAFHQAIQKHDKDFFSIAHEIGSKTVKQCIQFYYVWKKVCVDEYRRLRLNREQKGYVSGKSNSDVDFEEKPCLDTKLLGIAETESPMSVADHRHFSCDYSDCSASFNSRAALTGHIRIHGGAVRRSPTPTSHLERRVNSLTPTPVTAELSEEFPCKICGKVFSKIKSRSAHMKSHRPPDVDQKKKSTEYLPGLVPDTTISSPAAHAP